MRKVRPENNNNYNQNLDFDLKVKIGVQSRFFRNLEDLETQNLETRPRNLETETRPRNKHFEI